MRPCARRPVAVWGPRHRPTLLAGAAGRGSPTRASAAFSGAAARPQRPEAPPAAAGPMRQRGQTPGPVQRRESKEPCAAPCPSPRGRPRRQRGSAHSTKWGLTASSRREKSVQPHGDAESARSPRPRCRGLRTLPLRVLSTTTTPAGQAAMCYAAIRGKGAEISPWGGGSRAPPLRAQRAATCRLRRVMLKSHCPQCPSVLLK